MDDQSIEKLSRKFDVLIKLYAYQVVAGKSMPEGVPILRRIGLTSSEIADVYGTSTNTISVRLAEAKKKTTKMSEVKKGSRPKAK
jgi:hypothetical protein